MLLTRRSPSARTLTVESASPLATQGPCFSAVGFFTIPFEIALKIVFQPAAVQHLDTLSRNWMVHLYISTSLGFSAPITSRRREPEAARAEGGWRGSFKLELSILVTGTRPTLHVYFFCWENEEHTKGDRGRRLRAVAHCGTYLLPQ